MFISAAKRGFALGAKYGVLKGARMFTDATVETPEMDEEAMQGAIGIVLAVAGVLIVLYITAIIVGSISYSVTSGNIKLSANWTTTVQNIDQQAQATFNLAKSIILAGYICKMISFANRLQNRRRGNCVTDRNNWGWNPHDCNRGILRSRHLNNARAGENWTCLALANDHTTKVRSTNIIIPA